MSRSWCGTCSKDDEDCECYVIDEAKFDAAREEWRSLRLDLSLANVPALDALFLDEKTSAPAPTTTGGDVGAEGCS